LKVHKNSLKAKWAKQNDKEHILMVSDDGIGLPENIEIEESKSLGFKLVNSIVDQINGTIELDRTQGTQYIIQFKELEYKNRI
jgi:two-component sensor histidine kinase